MTIPKKFIKITTNDKVLLFDWLKEFIFTKQCMNSVQVKRPSIKSYINDKDNGNSLCCQDKVTVPNDRKTYVKALLNERGQ